MNDSMAFAEVIMDEKVFFRFSRFEVFRRSRQWLKLLAFFLVLQALAVFNLFTGADLLFWILMTIGVLVPLSFLIRYRASNAAQSRRFHLDKPKPMYRIDFSREDGRFTVSIQDQPERRFALSELQEAYRTRDAVYLYPTRQEAYLIPADSLSGIDADGLWAHVLRFVPDGRAHDRRRLFS